MKRRPILVLLLAVALTVLFAPATAAADMSPSPSPSPSPVAGDGVTFKIGIGEDIDSMNPFTAWSSVSTESFRIMYNFLTWYDVDYKPVPDLATEWTHNADGTEWTFTIREGVTWHDGEPLTAHDVAFTYNYIIDNELWMYLQYLEHVTKVEAPDDTTVVITSSEPNAMVLALYIPIVPEHIWSRIPGSKIEKLTDPPVVGSGPFKLAEARKSQYVKFAANKDYFEGPPAIDTLYFRIYQNADTLVQDYRTGALDVGYFETPTFLRGVKDMAGSKAVTVDRIGFHELGFNCWTDPKSKGNPLLRDARIRQAVHWAIDKDKIVAQAMDDEATAGSGVISPAAGDWHWEPAAREKVTFDPAKAKQILTDAGYIDRDGDGIRESENGQKLSWRFDVMSAYQNDITAAKMITTWLKDVGIDARLNIADEGAFGDRVYDNADHDMYIWSWGGDIDPGFMLSCFTTTQILNWSDSEYSNKEYDELYREQAGAIDRTERLELVHQMQQHLYEQAPYIVLWYNVDCQAYQAAKWTGWELVPPKDGRPIWTFLRGTYTGVTPVVAEVVGGGLSGGAVVGIAITAVVVAAGIAYLLLRRRKPAAVEEDSDADVSGRE